MLARISTRLPCSARELWQKIMEPRSLQFVAAPILSFTPTEAGALDREWEVGRAYPLKLHFLKFIPLGSHTIQLVRMDKETNTLVSHESGRLARVWNHSIFFQDTAAGTVSYTDEIDIRAGLLTPAIWLFAQLFYRYRQRRWKVMLRGSAEKDQEAN